MFFFAIAKYLSRSRSVMLDLQIFPLRVHVQALAFAKVFLFPSSLSHPSFRVRVVGTRSRALEIIYSSRSRRFPSFVLRIRAPLLAFTTCLLAAFIFLLREREPFFAFAMLKDLGRLISFPKMGVLLSYQKLELGARIWTIF